MRMLLVEDNQNQLESLPAALSGVDPMVDSVNRGAIAPVMSQPQSDRRSDIGLLARVRAEGPQSSLRQGATG